MSAEPVEKFVRLLKESPPGAVFNPWQLFHLYAVLGDFSVCLERIASGSLMDGDDFQVHIRRKPPIEKELELTKIAALFQGAEIEKPEIHRFLYFEDKGSRDKHPGYMGLEHANRLRLVRIRSRRLKKGNEFLL